MAPLHASQTFSSAVGRARGRAAEHIRIEDFELLTAVVAATRWRHNHPGGTFTLYADSIVAKFLERIGLLGLWDNVDTATLDAMPAGVNHNTFWAASKLYAYRAAPAGRVFMDLDFILWVPFDTLTDPSTGLRALDAALVSTHQDTYHSQDGHKLLGPYNTPPGYVFPDWVRLFHTGDYIGANASLLRLADVELKDFYLDHALRFIEGNPGNRPHPDPFGFAHMCLAEQNLVRDAALHLGKSICYLHATHGVVKMDDGPTKAIHLWGYKEEMRRNPAARVDYIRRALDRIEREAPAWAAAAYGLLQQPYELQQRISHLSGTDITSPALAG